MRQPYGFRSETPSLDRAPRRDATPRQRPPVTDPWLIQIGRLIDLWERRARGIELGTEAHRAVGFTEGSEHLTAKEHWRAHAAFRHALEMKRQLRDAYGCRKRELRYLARTGRGG